MIRLDVVNPKYIREEPSIINKVTYYVRLPGAKEERALCFRPSRKNKDIRCTLGAGFDTNHPGVGACKFHGGRAAVNITNGRRSEVTTTLLKDDINAYLEQDRGKLLDMTEELAAAKAILHRMINDFPDDTKDILYGQWLKRFNDSIGALSNLADKISKIESRNALTAAEVLYIRATMVDLFMKYIIDPNKREDAVKELAARLGGDVSVEMRNSEFRKLTAGKINR